MPRSFDVLIAGAGPAGSHAATLLAAQGMRVGLLDKARFPRDKVCGGGLSAKSLGLLHASVASVVQQTFSGALIAWRDRATFLKDMGRTVGCTVLRSEFDAWLVRRAQEAGAQFHQETRVERVTAAAGGVEVQTSAGRFGARLLLAADGVASSIRSQVFGRDVVRWGMFNSSGSWKTRFGRRSPRYTTRWAEILAVGKLLH